MIRYPWPIQNALDNRTAIGQEAVKRYWAEMSPQQRRAADLWIMKNRKDVFDHCKTGCQVWRFTELIEVLYAEHSKEKADKEAKKTGTKAD